MLRVHRCVSPLHRRLVGGKLLWSAVVVAAQDSTSHDEYLLGKGFVVICLFVALLISCLCRPDLHRSSNQGVLKTFQEKQRQHGLELDRHKGLVLGDTKNADQNEFDYQNLATTTAPVSGDFVACQKIVNAGYYNYLYHLEFQNKSTSRMCIVSRDQLVAPATMGAVSHKTRPTFRGGSMFARGRLSGPKTVELVLLMQT